MTGIGREEKQFTTWDYTDGELRPIAPEEVELPEDWETPAVGPVVRMESAADGVWFGGGHVQASTSGYVGLEGLFPSSVTLEGGMPCMGVGSGGVSYDTVVFGRPVDVSGPVSTHGCSR